MTQANFVPEFDFTPGGRKTPPAVAAAVGAERERGAALVDAAQIQADSRERGVTPGWNMMTHRWSNGHSLADRFHGKDVGAGGGGTAPRGANLVSPMGEPTSYAGGAGAPEPVGVIRGGTQTYSPTGGGPEYQTPLVAKQAYNQARDVGEFQPVGSNLVAQKTQAAIDINAAKPPDPYHEAAGKSIMSDLDKKREAAQGTAYKDWYINTHGGSVPKPGEPAFPAYYDALTHSMKFGGEAGAKRYRENIEISQAEPSFTAENLARFNLNPDKLAQLKTSNPDKYRQVAVTLATLMKQSGGNAPATPSGTNDPALNNMAQFGRNFYQGGVQTGELMGRGIRQVVPGANLIFNEQGRVKDFMPLNKDVPYNPDPYAQ